jgi:hypothetical protein
MRQYGGSNGAPINNPIVVVLSEAISDALRGEILPSTLMDRRGEKLDRVLDLRDNEGVIIGTSGTHAG